MIASDLLRTELLRATRRAAPDRMQLAGALELGDELDGIVTYDDRMAAAASL